MVERRTERRKTNTGDEEDEEREADLAAPGFPFPPDARYRRKTPSPSPIYVWIMDYLIYIYIYICIAHKIVLAMHLFVQLELICEDNKKLGTSSDCGQCLLYALYATPHPTASPRARDPRHHFRTVTFSNLYLSNLPKVVPDTGVLALSGRFIC